MSEPPDTSGREIGARAGPLEKGITWTGVGKIAARSFVGVFVLIGFFVTIWICSAQERLTSAFRAAAPGVQFDYNEALFVYDSATANHKLNASNASEIAQLQQVDIPQLELSVQEETQVPAALAQELRSYMNSSLVPESCARGAGAATLSPTQLASSARDLLQCSEVAGAATGTPLSRLRENIADDAAKYDEEERQIPLMAQKLTQEKMRLTQLQQQAPLDETIEKIPADHVYPLFAELNSIESGFNSLIIPGLGNFIVHGSPFLFQFLMAGFAGAFGALVLMLIVWAYPAPTLWNMQDVFLARITVGFLIAICVYVVLGTGSSLITAGEGGLDASHLNISGVAFLAILAGGFSDRVAGWLSDQANIIFAKRVQAAGAGRMQEPPRGES